MLHNYGSEPFERDELYRIDGDLLNMVFQLCRYLGRVDPDSHAVVNFVLGNLIHIVDHPDNKLGWNEDEFRAEMDKLGLIVPRRSD
jgi:hypothetical protein|tara:strand:+ start:1562 stop:1819 length:258 start_codon:yes stop_codon:yes gene_type:complete